MVLTRVLEPEVMDDPAEAIAYDAMDFSDVNQDFSDLVVASYPQSEAQVLDLGTGTAQIPILVNQQRPAWQITATDLAASMLAVGQQNLDRAGCSEQVKLQLADAKNLPFGDRHFDVVMSNSLIHHLPDPLPCFREMRRVLKPKGVIVLRDLFRPESEAIIDQIIASVDDANFDAHQLKLFRDSLFAAFTIPEIEAIANEAGLEGAKITQSSTRHWTMIFHA